MSRSERENEKLRAAFSSPGGEAAVSPGCPGDEEIWAATRGELPSEKAEELLAHSLRCAACKESWRVAAMLHEETTRQESIDVVPFVGRRRPIVPLIGVAAVLALVAILIPLALRQGSKSVPNWASGVQTTLWRVGDGGDAPLAGGDAVQPGDQIYLVLDNDVPVHVYLINRDQSGASATLFPIDGAQWSNPLPAGSALRLPGDTSWLYDSWEVSSAGGRESFIVVASAEPLEALESAIAGLDAARPADDYLRGEDPTPAPGRDPEMAEAALRKALQELQTRAPEDSVVLRRITLDNPR